MSIELDPNFETPDKTQFSPKGELGVMGLSRRRFTREFKEAAVRRLEMGVPVAEVSRACEVSPNVLYRWRRELREFGSRAFSGRGTTE
jgi:transposase